MGVTRQSVQRIADLLVDRGLAEYLPNPAHRRAKLPRPTDAGHAAVAPIDPAHAAFAERLVDHLGVARLAPLLDDLRTPSQAPDEMAPGGGGRGRGRLRRRGRRRPGRRAPGVRDGRRRRPLAGDGRPSTGSTVGASSAGGRSAAELHSVGPPRLLSRRGVPGSLVGDPRGRATRQDPRCPTPPSPNRPAQARRPPCPPPGGPEPVLFALLGAHAASAAAVLAARRRLGRAAWVVGALGPAAVLAWLAANAGRLADGEAVEARAEWIGGLDLALDLRVDAFAALMLVLVAGIGVLVFAYARSYLGPAPRAARAAALLALFAGAMTGVVVA